jgi:hypothetical protein
VEGVQVEQDHARERGQVVGGHPAEHDGAGHVDEDQNGALGRRRQRCDRK